MNRGAVELAQKLTDRGAVRKLGTEQGISHSLVSRWQCAEQKPETKYRVLLNQLYGIEILAWDDEVSVAPSEGSAAE